MKKFVLPIIAGAAIIAAVGVTVLAPKTDTTSQPSQSLKVASSSQILNPTANADGDYLIEASALSSDLVTFIRPSTDSKTEFLARIGEDGQPKIALGTCQSCNGAPGAYYTQEGDVLRCNNCGLTFPLTVLDEPGGGCHPIMLIDEAYQRTDDGIVLPSSTVAAVDQLFTQVAEH